MVNEPANHRTIAAEAIKSDVKNSVFLGNPVLDNVVSCVIALGTELWATKRRMKVMEAVMAKHGVTEAMLEQYKPTDKEVAAWEADRDRFIDLTMGPLGNEGFRNVAANFPKRD